MYCMDGGTGAQGRIVSIARSLPQPSADLPIMEGGRFRITKVTLASYHLRNFATPSVRGDGSAGPRVRSLGLGAIRFGT